MIPNFEEHPRYAEVMQMRISVIESVGLIATCFDCKERVYFVEMDFALMPGQVYSRDGLKEFRISQLCEYCFDKVADDWESGEASFDGAELYFDDWQPGSSNLDMPRGDTF